MKTRKIHHPATALNEHDKKILDKYTKFYSNFIENNTAKNSLFDNDRHKQGDK